MKKVIYKIVSLSMAALLLLSTTSWTVEKHLCMGRVMDTALFAHAQDCGMKAGLAVLEDASLQSHCCGDEVFTVEGQDELQVSAPQFHISQELYYPFIGGNYPLLSCKYSQKNKVSVEASPPPLLGCDLNILYQVFII